ncbi:MAG: VOC family protein [Pikeienuella sp.]
MPRIETVLLRVRDPAAQRRFYCDVLGMRYLGRGLVGYGGAEAAIRFLQADLPYDPTPRDLYWKIALAVPDIELACAQLASRGVVVGSPEQFQDVGYLAHFRDPEGFAIELIDHAFKGEGGEVAIDPAQLGGGAHLNLITLRAAEIEPVQSACAEWGMTPLSVQPVTDYGFTLYFFGFAPESPPAADLTAVENRCWTYQRAYTVLEVQHVGGAEVAVPMEGRAGYAGVEITGARGPEVGLMLVGRAES